MHLSTFMSKLVLRSICVGRPVAVMMMVLLGYASLEACLQIRPLE